MRSIESFMKRKMKRMNNKGQVVSTVQSNMLNIGILIFFMVAIFYGIVTLNPSSFFTAGSSQQNATNKLIDNLTTGTAQFGDFIPVGFKIFGVVFAIAGIVLLLLYVQRMRSASGQGSGGGVNL